MEVGGKQIKKVQQCNKTNPKKVSMLLLSSQHVMQNTRKTEALASLNSHLSSSLKVTIEKLGRQFVFHWNLNSLFGMSGGERRKTTFRKQKSKQRKVKEKITISSTVIYYTNIYRRQLQIIMIFKKANNLDVFPATNTVKTLFSDLDCLSSLSAMYSHRCRKGQVWEQQACTWPKAGSSLPASPTPNGRAEGQAPAGTLSAHTLGALCGNFSMLPVYNHRSHFFGHQS